MTERELDVMATAMLDQHWMQAERWIDEFGRIAGTHSIAELVQNVPGIETLIKKACAMVAEQARQNIRDRESDRE